MKTCTYCKKEYKPKGNFKKQKYCSRECKDQFTHQSKRKIKDRNTIVKKNCEYCGKYFETTYRYFTKRYCCKSCQRSHWRKLNPEKDKAQTKRSREKLKADPVRYARHRKMVSIKNQSPERKYAHYKKGAEIRNYSFELTFEQFMDLWQKPCSYCGSEIKTIGIDRKNNDMGYTAENSIPCCVICNRMKMKIDYKDFISHCKKISNFQSTIRA